MDRNTIHVEHTFMEQLQGNLIHNALIQNLPESYHFGPHTHRNIEICVVQTGECDIIINGNKVTVHKNEFIVLFPHVIHSFQVKENKTCSFMQMHFYVEHFEALNSGLKKDLKFMQYLSKKTKLYIKAPTTKQIQNCMERITDEMNDRNIKGNVLSNLYIFELVLLLSREMEPNFHNPHSEENLHVAKAIQYIHEHIEERLSLDEIAIHCNISKRHLTDLFKRYLRITVNDYVQITKLNYIMDYMSDNHTNFTELAYRYGFSSPQYFSTIFKRIVGVSPKEFMKMKSVKHI